MIIQLNVNSCKDLNIKKKKCCRQFIKNSEREKFFSRDFVRFSSMVLFF